MPPTEPTPTPNEDFDREQLRELTQSTSEPGKYFGKDVLLTNELRHQLDLVTQQAKKVLQPFIDQYHTQWQEYLRLTEEGKDKGVLLSMTSHEGTFVPTWCVDGGALAGVEKIRVDGVPRVQVPTHIFNLINWLNITQSIEKVASLSNETIKGRSTSQLGLALTQMSYLLTTTQDTK